MTNEIPPPVGTPTFETSDWYAQPTLPYQRVYPDAAPLQTPEEGNAGYDLRAYLGEGQTLDIRPDSWYKFSTGIAVAIPRGYVGLVWSRSGMTFNMHFKTWGAGVIDNVYRGEVWLSMYSLDQEFVLHHNDRIAQLIIVPYIAYPVQERHILDVTVRGDKGLGSSGVK